MIDQLSKTNNSTDLFGEQVKDQNVHFENLLFFLDFKKDSARDNDLYK
jgi:hypothetical protein